MISAEDVSFDYSGTSVLEHVGITAHAGQVLGLIGPNGSGKTTLLRTLYASLKPRAGWVSLDGDRVEQLKPRDLAKRVAVVVQEGAGDLPLTVNEMVLLGRVPHMATFQRHGAHDYEVAATALDRVGALHLASRVFAGLSGGEKQRVLIARALAQGSHHILLDEPTNHLDIRYQHEVMQLIRSLDVTTVVVLHDLNLASLYCDRLVLLQDGRTRRTGSPADVLRPDILRDVYEIDVQQVTVDGTVQLLFRPSIPPDNAHDDRRRETHDAHA